ncbi:MAG: transcription-repair coupling factor [Ruminococcaceae bacterium]|nr:transcription-repair coupling factor [Oscillospiraceae bacterium]
MLIRSCMQADGEYRQLSENLAKAFGDRSLPFAASGLCDGAANALILSLLTDLKQVRGGAALCVLSEEKECAKLQGFLEQYGIRVAFFAARDLTFYNITASHEYEHERLRVLCGLRRGDFDVILTTPDAALGYTISAERLEKNTIRLDSASVLEMSVLTARLTAAGYTRVDMVEGAGQFAVRGGIIDIFAPHLRALSADNRMVTGMAPLRIELFGDEIDRMGIFDVESQRIHTVVTDCEIPPAREVLVDASARAAVREAVAAKLAKVTDERAAEELRGELAEIDGGGELRFADKYLTLIDPARECLLSYFPPRSLTFLRGTNAINDRLKASQWHRERAIEELMEAGTVSGRYADYSKPESAFFAYLAQAVTLHVDSIAEGLSGKKLAGLYGFRSRHTPAYGERFELLEEDIGNYLNTRWRVILVAENETSAKAVKALLEEHGHLVRVQRDGEDELPQPGEILIEWQEPTLGFELPLARTAVLSLSTEQRAGGLAAAGRIRHAKKKKDAKRAILSYAELEPGDLVVHEAHGIGRYVGLETLTIDGVTKDYISIQYAGSDQLFLPCDRLDAVSKYIGAHADDGMVKLSRFGGGEWKKAKARAKTAVKDMAKDLIRLYAERERRAGFAFPPDDAYQRDFEAAFAYEETEGQIAAAEEIKQDMMSVTPMDRLLCGDVGFGKTEVALRAAYKAILAGKQVAILVPTTILAMQHFRTIQSRMRAFAVRADMLSRFRTPKEQQQSLARLARGDTDIIVGTHRLVSADVSFKNLGLLIVDEEQRFGVAQKEKIKQMAGNVDVLTLTATPIPRTLNMAMSGIRDISILDEAPGDRLPVQTYVLEDDDLIIEEAIRRELRRGGQVFYLHNAVESIHTVAARLSREIPEARIAVAHGQMDKETLERIWGDMITGETDILVSTTIIETGVDVPNANTLIVDNAHRLGLSQLHQLRGRVGRSPRRAYAYFTYPRGRALGDVQRKRLEAIREYAEFGAGFRIALRDLELRGAGNLLGAEQHGHLDAVGYDLYVKLLNEAVLTEKGETVTEKAECVVSLSYDANLPERYVKSANQRMSLYKRISLIASRYDMSDMTDELLDRYGDLPKAASNLLRIALIRSLAQNCGITQIRQDGADVHIGAPQLDVEIWMELANRFPGKMRMMLSASPYIRYHIEKKTAALEDLIELFLAYGQIAEDRKKKTVDK